MPNYSVLVQTNLHTAFSSILYTLVLTAFWNFSLKSQEVEKNQIGIRNEKSFYAKKSLLRNTDRLVFPDSIGLKVLTTFSIVSLSISPNNICNRLSSDFRSMAWDGSGSESQRSYCVKIRRAHFIATRKTHFWIRHMLLQGAPLIFTD